MNKRSEETSALLVMVTIVVAAAVFILDLILPLDITVWIPYIALVLLSLWIPSRQYTIIVAMVCTVLIFLGFFFPPRGESPRIALFNRAFGVFIIWALAILCLLRKQSETLLRKAKDELEIKVTKRTIELKNANEQLQIELDGHRQTEEALHNSLAQLSKKNRYETIISTVTRSVHQSINLQEVLENALESMSRNIDGVDNVSIYMVEGEEAVIKAYRGYPQWFTGRIGRIPYPRGFTWKTIIEGKPTYCADVDQDTVIGPAGREVGTKSYVSMPIHFQNKTIGTININSLRKNAFDEEDLKLLEIVAQQIEIAINNAQQAEALQKARDELEMRVRERTAELTEVNEALQAEISEHKRAEEQIKASLQEKETLLREIHHRVKNNLQVISALLSLQLGLTKNAETRKLFNETQSRIRSMSLIHQQLYKSTDLKRIDFTAYIQNLVCHLFRSYGIILDTITLEIKGNDIKLNIDTAIYCGLIINELVSNSLKYAFPEVKGGKVYIYISSDADNSYTLIVGDDGIGLPKEIDFRNTESLGLQVVVTLVEQIDGTIELNRSKGTEFKITFKELNSART